MFSNIATHIKHQTVTWINYEFWLQVCEYLGISNESDYFGLKYESSKGRSCGWTWGTPSTDKLAATATHRPCGWPSGLSSGCPRICCFRRPRGGWNGNTSFPSNSGDLVSRWFCDLSGSAVVPDALPFSHIDIYGSTLYSFFVIIFKSTSFL